MISIRRIIQDSFIANPELNEKSPSEIVEFINSSMNISVTSKNWDETYTFKVTPKISFHRSNIKGYYFVIVCDICRNTCMKGYPKEIQLMDKKISKLLCGKCARIKYKRKTELEKRTLEAAVNPDVMANYRRNLDVKNGIIALGAVFLHEEIKEKSEKIWDRLSNKNPQIVE